MITMAPRSGSTVEPTFQHVFPLFLILISEVPEQLSPTDYGSLLEYSLEYLCENF